MGRQITDNLTTIIVVLIITGVSAIVILGLISYSVSIQKPFAAITKVQILDSTSSACGSNNPCIACVETTYADGSKTIEKKYRPAGTPCADQCVTEGTCTGFSPLDDEKREPYCNATSYVACRGSCTDYTDCILPVWMTGMTDQGHAVCISGSCLYSMLFVNTTGGNPPPTVLYDYSTDNILRMNKEAEVCRWIIRDGLEVNNSKNCLDYGLFGYENIFAYYGCLYQYICARPNFNGPEAPPFTLFNLMSTSEMSDKTHIPTMADSISAPPEMASFFKSVKSTKEVYTQLLKATMHVTNKRLSV